MQYLEKNVNGLVNCDRVSKNDVIGFTEIQMKASDSITRMNNSPKCFNM